MLDSAQYVPAYKQQIRKGIAASKVRVGDIEELSDTVKIIKEAAWLAMRVVNGAEAMQLLLRSDRIYVDILQADLFAKPDKDTGKKVCVSTIAIWFYGSHPLENFAATRNLTSKSMCTNSSRDFIQIGLDLLQFPPSMFFN